MKFVNAHLVAYEPHKFLAFDDVLLLPHGSDIESRNDPRLDLSTKLTSNIGLRIPILSANMDTVTDSDMVKAMKSKGAFGILHRFHKSPEDYIGQIRAVAESVGIVAFSIGANPAELNFVERVMKEVPAQHYVVCVDLAHGHLKKSTDQVRGLRKAFGTSVQIIGGNVATPQGVRDLVVAGANAIKLGVGGGSHCTTREVTGCGCPQLTTIMQARMAINGMGSNVALIADGGIRTSGDIVKALAAGADSVMIGRLFAATKESPGQILEHPWGSSANVLDPISWIPAVLNTTDINGKPVIYDQNIPTKNWVKKYRGQSSFDFLQDIGKTDVTPEGESSYIPYRGSVIPILENLIGGIKSGLSYCGCRNLTELSEKALFIEISANAHIEGTPHGL